MLSHVAVSIFKLVYKLTIYICPYADEYVCLSIYTLTHTHIHTDISVVYIPVMYFTSWYYPEVYLQKSNVYIIIYLDIYTCEHVQVYMYINIVSKHIPNCIYRCIVRSTVQVNRLLLFLSLVFSLIFETVS